MKLRLIGGTAAVGRYACTLCGDRYTDRRVLERHLRRVHAMKTTDDGASYRS